MALAIDTGAKGSRLAVNLPSIEGGRTTPTTARAAHTPTAAALYSPYLLCRIPARGRAIMEKAAAELTLVAPAQQTRSASAEPGTSLQLSCALQPNGARALVSEALDHYDVKRIVQWLLAPGWSVHFADRTSEALAAALHEAGCDDLLDDYASALQISPVVKAYYCLRPLLELLPRFDGPFAAADASTVFSARLVGRSLDERKLWPGQPPAAHFRLQSLRGDKKRSDVPGEASSSVKQLVLEMFDGQSRPTAREPLLTYFHRETVSETDFFCVKKEYFGEMAGGVFWATHWFRRGSTAEGIMRRIPCGSDAYLWLKDPRQAGQTVAAGAEEGLRQPGQTPADAGAWLPLARYELFLERELPSYLDMKRLSPEATAG